jgi:type IX secretion system substrate protein/beta-propeller repeat-containing protein
MKKIYLSIAVLFLCSIANSQEPNWLWAKSAGGNNWDTGYCIASDLLGNVYVTGLFQSPTITFGNITLVNSSEWQDIFIVKYDPAGNVLWAKSAGGSGSDEGTSITTDTSGNIYLAGYFGSNTINFGNTTLVRNGSFDIFLAKYDSSGNLIWAKSIGGIGDDEWPKITTDVEGNLYMSGWFQSSSIKIGNTTLVNSGGLWDFFIAKYNSHGHVIWAKGAGGSGADNVRGISTDTENNVYLTGGFTSPILSFDNIFLSNAGGDTYSDVFIVKYSSIGSVLWAKRAGGNNFDDGYSVTTDNENNTYLTGTFFSPTINFDSKTLINSGSCDIFIAKYNPFGEVIWAKSAGGNSCDNGIDIVQDAFNNIYVTGYFSSSSIAFGSSVLTSNEEGIYDIYIAKYDTSGNPLWAKSVGGGDIDWGESITVDPTGNLFLAGGFLSPTIDFGNSTLINAGGTMPGANYYPDIFIAKLSSSNLSIDEPLENDNSVFIYPNPFSNTATISFFLNQSEKISLKIFDLNGRLVKTISDGFLAEGKHSLPFDGEKLNSSIYLLQLRGENFSKTEKLIFTK